MPSSVEQETEWLQSLSQAQPIVAEMLARTPQEQQHLGYFHTLREICQQPATWLRTAQLMRQNAPALRQLLAGISSVILTGSGSSEYAGDCARLPLQKELGANVQAIGGGALLTHGRDAFPVGRPGVMVSIARSGDSPESVGALALILKAEPELRHLVLTCNTQGKLANTFRDDARVTVITLDECTNDRSLVMTSSFTNLVLGARSLGLAGDSARYLAIVEALSRAATNLLQAHFGDLAQIARKPFRRALFLGSGARFAATREAALKMLEMTAGRVITTCETYLGLRHGPMSAIHGDTLVVCFLSSDPMVRAYEMDLLRELTQKRLGMARIIAGQDVPYELVTEEDLVVSYQSSSRLADDNMPVLDVLVGQLIAFFRCLQEGLRPDSPSDAGVISRVVQGFALHTPRG